MTGRNPNVFYEVGYAHGIAKRTILVTHIAEDIPFDLKHFPHIVYEGSITRLRDELKRRVRWFIETPAKQNEFFDSELRVFANSVSLANIPTLECGGIEGHSRHIRLEMDFHNEIKARIAGIQFQIALVTPKTITHVRATQGLTSNGSYQVKRIAVEKHEDVYVIDSLLGILPGSWEKLFLHVSGRKIEIGGKEAEEPFAIRE